MRSPMEAMRLIKTVTRFPEVNLKIFGSCTMINGTTDMIMILAA